MAAAMDTYRVNIYKNITGPSKYTNRLIQGGFRYQELSLDTAGEITLKNVGVKPTTSTTPIHSLPGSFECSDDVITDIWNVGARTIQLNEVPANSIPAFWEVSSEGSYVSSQSPQVLASITAAMLTSYEVEFEVKPIVDGFSFSVLSDTLNTGIYIWCNIANGTISANAGASEAKSGFLAQATLPSNKTVGNWHKVHALVNLTDITISIDNSQVLKFTQTSSFYGSFGLGAALGQSAMFRNLNASTLTGTPVYSSALNDDKFLADFFMGPNPINATVDGSKRDRIAYTGDLDVSAGSTLASTFGTEYVLGTLNLFAGYQALPGFFVPTAKIQQQPSLGPFQTNMTGLIGYSFNILCAVSKYYQSTGNITLAKDWAPRIVHMLEWAHSQTLPEKGLFNVSDPSIGGDWNYYDPAQSGVVTKFNTLYAYTLQSTLTILADAGVNTTAYSSRLDALRVAIDEQLWSNDLGAYYVSESLHDAYGQDSNAYAILAGVTGRKNHTYQQVLRSLEKLYTPYGPLSFSENAFKSGFMKVISPFASAYHLRAALSVGNGAVARKMLQTLWSPMANPTGANYTGCFWEAVSPEGALGLGALTSLCHAWSSGPTSELTTYVLGIQPAKPGYTEWLFSPVTMGLAWARGVVPVPGGSIHVSWNATDDIITHVDIIAPKGTTGTIRLPRTKGSSSTSWQLNGRAVSRKDNTFKVEGGKRTVLVRK